MKSTEPVKCWCCFTLCSLADKNTRVVGCLHRFACLSGLVRVDDVLIYTCFTVLGPLPPHKCCWYVREVKIENPDFSKHIYFMLVQRITEGRYHHANEKMFAGVPNSTMKRLV